MTKVFHDTELGDIRLVRSLRSKTLRIRIHPSSGISITIPALVSYKTAIDFFTLNRERVIAVVQKQKQAHNNKITLHTADGPLIHEQAGKVLPRKTAILAQRYGFQYKRLALKNNKSNWGSCCRLNINLNIHLVSLPEALCDYVILHELCHLRHHNHGTEFHALLESLCKDNLKHLVDKYEGKPIPEDRKEEYQVIKAIEAAATKSRSKEPYRYSMEKMIRSYRLD